MALIDIGVGVVGDLLEAGGDEDSDGSYEGGPVIIYKRFTGQSTNVFRAEYNRLTRMLTVWMQGGSYDYPDEPEDTFHSLVRAASKGQWVWARRSDLL